MVIATMRISGADTLNASDAKTIASKIRKRKTSDVFVGGNGARVELRLGRSLKTHPKLVVPWLMRQAESIEFEGTRKQYSSPYTAKLYA
jgi:hypothetical protein